MTTTQNKYKITIIALVMGMLALLGAVIGVWAASSQNLKVGFDVSYDVGENVAVEVRTEYRVAGGAVQTITDNSEGQTIAGANGYVRFDASEEASDKLLNIENVALTPQASYVEYFFTVHSLQSEDFVQAAFWIDFATKNNMLVDYWYCNKTKNEFNANSSATTITDWNMNQLDNASAEGYKFIKVVLEVGDLNAWASSSGTFNFMLNSDERQQSVSTLREDYIYSINFVDYGMTLTTAYRRGNTGVDLSTGNGSGIYYEDNVIYSADTICLPEDASTLFQRWVDLAEDSQGYAWDAFIFNNIDTSNVVNMDNMLNSYNNFIIGVEKFNVSNVEDMESLFNGLNGDYLDLTQWNTSNVNRIRSMFSNSNLKRIYVGDNWSVTNVSDDYNHSGMFDYCDNLRGAVSYDESKTDKAMANWETGYLTFKASRI